ncbi:MAG: hypothetical protein KDB21_03810 [Acidimicrobiales bacterium]|nr:hypothetical protein [Acidimicrobiales bacterium]
MPWRDLVRPSEMSRVALVAPAERLRKVLVAVGEAGLVELDAVESPGAESDVVVSFDPPADTDADGPIGLGEAELRSIDEAAAHTKACSVITGWARRADLDELRAALEPVGAGVVELELPRHVLPPTSLPDQPSSRSLRPLVDTYAVVPYQDLDPTWFAGIVYLLMFGAMFGDVGHGAALALAGLGLRRSHRARLASLSRLGPFLVGAGMSAVVFGLLYGEAFGPTGLVPTLWIRPLDEPETLLATGLMAGVVLLALTFAMAAVNRWREGGARMAMFAATGVAGSALFAGVVVFAGGAVLSVGWMMWIGSAMAIVGAVLVFVGLLAGSGGGSGAVAEAIVEMFDVLIRLGSNLVSFTRLAAFGLTHAVITGVVWDGTVGLWDRGSALTAIEAVGLMVVGNVAAFALGALVGAIQALRLEYYELFSRLFASEGRPFRPWRPRIERRTTE